MIRNPSWKFQTAGTFARPDPLHWRESMAFLIDIATASPPFVVRQSIAAAGLKQRMGTSPAVGRLIDMAASRSGITTRNIVIGDAEPDIEPKFFAVSPDGPHPGTAQRMNLY